MENIKIDPNKCIGCGACNSIAPNNFGFGESNAIVIDQNVNEEVEEAVNACPTSAITIEKKD